MAEVPIEQLKKNINYSIEVKLTDEMRHDYRGLSRGKYLGEYTREGDDDDDDDDDIYAYEETIDEYDDGTAFYLFVINNYFPDGGDKTFIIKKNTTLLKFMRPESFKEWGKNITMNNVTFWRGARKSRPSRSKMLEIPMDVARDYLKFKELIDSNSRALSDVLTKKLALDEDTIKGIATKINSYKGGRKTRRGKTYRKGRKSRKSRKNRKNRKSKTYKK